MNNFPDQNIDPKDKGKEWILKYAKAMWNECAGQGVFNYGADRYRLNRLYRMGKQDYDPLPETEIKDQDDNAYAFSNLPREVIGFIVEKIDRIKAKILGQDFRIFASPIDQEGAEGANSYYASIVARLEFRKQLVAAAQQGSQEAAMYLQTHPGLQMKKDEPQDEDELQTMVDFGEQFNRSEAAEHVIDLAMFDNDYPILEDETVENFINDGVSGIMNGLDVNGNPMLEVPNNSHLIVSPCKKKDFSDMRYWGVIEEVAKTDLQIEGMEQEQLAAINNGWNTPNDTGTVKVLRGKFYSVDEKVWDFNFDQFSRPHMPGADYGKRNKKKKDERAAFIARKIQNVYQFRWVIGTDILLDGYGLEKDMPRSKNPSRMSKTNLGLTMYAPSMAVDKNGRMIITSLMDRVIPLIKNWQTTYDRYISIKEHWIPSGYAVDTSAMDGVMLGVGNTPMTKREIMDIFREMGLLLYNSKGLELDKAGGNYKPINVIQNSIAADLAAIYQDLVNIKSQIQEVLGDAESGVIAPRTTNDVIAIAANNTGLALWPLAQGRKMLAERAANAAYFRVQQTIAKKGSYSGNAAVGSSTMKFVYADRDTPLPEAGIRLEWLPTEQDKQYVIQAMQQDIANKLLDTSDVYYIMGRFNLRQSLRMIAIKVRRKEKMLQQQAMEAQRMNGQIQTQSAMAVKQAEAELARVTSMYKKEEIQLTADLALRNAIELRGMEVGKQDGINQAKVHAAAITADGKLDTERIRRGEAPVSEPAPVLPDSLPDTLDGLPVEEQEPVDMEDEVATQ